jgi:agmatine deiminase
VNDLRQPAEWAPHAATWVAWPSADDLWLENLGPAQAAFTAMCAALADVDPVSGAPRGERLHVLVPDAASEAHAKAALAPLGAVLHRVRFGDIWLRDTAPIFLRSDVGRIAAARFAFNGWGGKYVLDHDDAVAARVSELAGHETRVHPFVLEGGSVEVDGEGTVLSTRQCLLNPNRNPSMSDVQIERAVLDAFGAEKLLWLGDGLLNDHTDGHIDTIARFVRPGVVVCMRASGTDDPNARVMDDIARDLAAMTDARGRRIEVVRIPSPGRVLSAEGHVMPASYVNFYIGDTTVVVPTYGSPFDDAAVRGIEALFPGRRTVGIDARAILSGGGAFHCITQQEPRAGLESKER